MVDRAAELGALTSILSGYVFQMPPVVLTVIALGGVPEGPVPANVTYPTVLAPRVI